MLTKLEAVNQMLDAIGEDPVSSLDDGLPDASSAITTLDRVSKRIQAKGWHCNTDEEYELAINGAGKIPVTDNMLRVDTAGTDAWRDVVARVDESDGNRYLYDRDNQTFVFTRNLKVDVVWHFDFEDLTFALADYIAVQASVEFQKSELGSVALDAFIKERLRDTWAAVQDAEAEAEDSNVLRQSPHMAFATYRNYYHNIR